MADNLHILLTRSESPSVKRSRRDYDDDDDDDDSLSGGVGAPSAGSIRVTQVSYLGERPCDYF